MLVGWKNELFLNPAAPRFFTDPTTPTSYILVFLY